MIVIDENIIDSQRPLLLRRGLHVRQIGFEIGHKGMDDVEQVIPLPHQLRHATLFTRDLGFYDRALCHLRYCIVVLGVSKTDVAKFVVRTLRHPKLNTQKKRVGKVVRAVATGIRFWASTTAPEQALAWPK